LAAFWEWLENKLPLASANGSNAKVRSGFSPRRSGLKRRFHLVLDPLPKGTGNLLPFNFYDVIYAVAENR
jgi:hypothetical protein